MTNAKFEEMLKEIHEWEIKTNQKKAHDYANDANTLNNFEIQAQILKALALPEAPWAQCIRMVVVKIIRYANLAKKNVEAQNETLLDTVGDARQYMLLAEACRKECKSQ